MREDDFGHYINLALFAIVVGIIAGLSFRSFNEPPSHQPPAAAPAPAASAAPARGSVCGQVIGACRIKTSLKTTACTPEGAAKELLASLSDPMATPECQNEEKALSDDCALGCRFDYSNLIVVPGELKTDFSPEKDESGKCLIKSRRTVTIRGLCVPTG